MLAVKPAPASLHGCSAHVGSKTVVDPLNDAAGFQMDDILIDGLVGRTRLAASAAARSGCPTRSMRPRFATA